MAGKNANRIGRLKPALLPQLIAWFRGCVQA
jgi:hypothetical protein